MLSDTVRTKSYQNAIMNAKEIIMGKTVLDIGCGTGILSLFAASAGAKHVYGIDMATIANIAKNNIISNGFSDKISIFRGKMEDLELPF